MSWHQLKACPRPRRTSRSSCTVFGFCYLLVWGYMTYMHMTCTCCMHMCMCMCMHMCIADLSMHNGAASRWRLAGRALSQPFISCAVKIAQKSKKIGACRAVRPRLPPAWIPARAPAPPQRVAASSAGHSGAALATWEHVHRHFADAALLSPKMPHIPLAGQRSAVKSEPVCGDHRAHRRDMRAFQSQAIARNPTPVDFGALRTPYRSRAS